MKTAQLERVAYHEAGHTVLAHFLCTGLATVSIVSDHESAGHTLSVDEGDPDVEQLYLTADDAFWQRKAIVLFAGGEAVRYKWPNSRWRDGVGNDYHWAANALERITTDAQAFRALHVYASRSARLKVADYWPEIECVALALIERKTLTADEVKAEIWKLQQPTEAKHWITAA